MTKETKPEAGAVVVPPKSQVAMPMSWKDRMKAVAVHSAKAEAPQGGFISFKGGRITIGETMVPNDKMEAIIVFYLFHNKFYSTAYDAKRVTPPDCYAFATLAENLAPIADDVEDQQSTECAGCPMNEWGSSLKGGRGKACANSRRLWVLPADVMNDPTRITKVEPFVCDLPVTSVKNFTNFTTDLSASGLPYFAAVVEISTKPDDNTLFQVRFKAMETIKNEAVLEQLAMVNYRLEQQPFPKYPTAEELAEREAGNAPAQKSGKF